MQFDEFIQLMETQTRCPESLSPQLQALWYAKKGDWDKAHRIVQDAGDLDSAWVHAYLHREEGDLSNARYWYKRSGRSQCQESLDREWEQIVKYLLGEV